MQNDLEFTREMTAFFEAIPDDMWCSGFYQSSILYRRCAMGHVLFSNGCSSADRLKSIAFLYLGGPVVESINDGDVIKYQQPTPKLRVLAALKDIEEKILAQAESEIECKSAAIQSELALAQAKQIINEPVQELCSK